MRAKSRLHLLFNRQVLIVDADHRPAQRPRQPFRNRAPTFQTGSALQIGHRPAHINHQRRVVFHQLWSQPGKNLFRVNRGMIQRGFLIGQAILLWDLRQEGRIIG